MLRALRSSSLRRRLPPKRPKSHPAAKAASRRMMSTKTLASHRWMAGAKFQSSRKTIRMPSRPRPIVHFLSIVVVFAGFSVRYLPTTPSSSSTVTGIFRSPMMRLPDSVTRMSSSMRMPPKSR